MLEASTTSASPEPIAAPMLIEQRMRAPVFLDIISK